MMRSLLLLILSSMLLAACTNDDSGEEGDLDYFCDQWAPTWCDAYADCDPFNFNTNFSGDRAQCVEQTTADCLNPRSGRDRCDGASRDETDDCVDYILSNHPEGCHLLFGPQADMTPCEEICQ
jgi:hypothetical protein